MSDLLSEKTPIRARHIRPGQGQAVEVKTGQLLQIQTLQGKQVADFVAFTLGDTDEYLSTSATRSSNASIIPQLGMMLYSNRRQPMFEVVADTVGRHDMLYICCDPVRYELLGAPGHASCREALVEALTAYGIGYDRIPSPINWFMNVSIMQRGELEIREPLAEQGDYVVLRALKDAVAAVSACPQDIGPTNATNPTDLSIRIFRDEPLPPIANLVGAPMIGEEPAPDVAESDEQPADDAVSGEEPAEAGAVAASDSARAETPAERRAARRAERQAAAAAANAAPAEAVDAGEPAVAPVADPADAPEAPEATASATPRPARLRDTAEGTVHRVENAESGDS